jgi:vacuolar-type H+-ATPase subunit I/STV1
MKVIQMAILSTMLIVTAVFAAQQPGQKEEMATSIKQSSQSLETATMNTPLRQKTNKFIQNLKAVAPKIDRAIEAIQAARSKEDIYAELDEGQSQVRILLNTIKENGSLVEETQRLLEDRKVELEGYQSLDVSKKQREKLIAEETLVINGFEKLLEDIEKARENLKELDKTFTSTRTFMAKILSVRSAQQALKIAEDSVSSLTEVSKNFLDHIKEMADKGSDEKESDEHEEHTPE